MALARDASSSGDLVAAENYLQHAEHYQRIVNVHTERAAERAAEQQRDRPERNDEPQREQREERDDRSRRDDRYGRDENETDTAETVVESRQPKPAATATEGEEEGAVVESRQPAPVVARDTDDDAAPAAEAVAEEPAAKPARKPRRRTPKAAKPDDAADGKKKEDQTEVV
jgi:hypothetical protein